MLPEGANEQGTKKLVCFIHKIFKLILFNFFFFLPLVVGHVTFNMVT